MCTIVAIVRVGHERRLPVAAPVRHEQLGAGLDNVVYRHQEISAHGTGRYTKRME